MRPFVGPKSHRRAVVLASHALENRHALTASEALLWSRLRARQLGVVFRRQVVLGRFIVDFFARETGLVVEVDGGWHERRRLADERRDRTLRRLGYRVLRIEAEVVMRELAVAVSRVQEAVAAASAALDARR